MGALDAIRASPDLSLGRLDVLQGLAAEATPRRFPSGAHLFYEGDDPSCAYLVVNGLVRLFQPAAEDRRFSIDDMRAGNLVGEMSALCGIPRPAAAVAVTHTEVLRLPTPSLQRALTLDARLSYALLLSTMRLVLEKDSRMATWLAGDVTARLAWQLNFEYLRSGSNPRLCMSHAALAERIGASRETVSRALAKLRRKGDIRSDSAGIVEIVNIDNLRRSFVPAD